MVVDGPRAISPELSIRLAFGDPFAQLSNRHIPIAAPPGAPPVRRQSTGGLD